MKTYKWKINGCSGNTVVDIYLDHAGSTNYLNISIEEVK